MIYLTISNDISWSPWPFSTVKTSPSGPATVAQATVGMSGDPPRPDTACPGLRYSCGSLEMSGFFDPLVMTNRASHGKMAHRNRWFTVLRHAGSFHGYVK